VHNRCSEQGFAAKRMQIEPVEFGSAWIVICLDDCDLAALVQSLKYRRQIISR
jgi:hypothetical protein